MFVYFNINIHNGKVNRILIYRILILHSSSEMYSVLA